MTVASGSLMTVSETSLISTGAPPSAPAVLDDDGALLDDEGRDGLLGVGLGEEAGEVPAAVGVAEDAQARALQFHLEDGELAGEELFLVVVDDGGGDVEEVGHVGVVAARHAQLGDGDAAEEAQAGRFDGDVGAGELGGELGEDVGADLGGVGPVLVGDPAGADGGGDAENQAPHDPLAPCHVTSLSGPGFRGAG